LAGATIMMLSSSPLDGERSRCQELGIAACLTKPVKGKDLLDAICRTLDNRKRTPSATTATRAHHAALKPAVPVRVVNVLIVRTTS